MMNFSASQRVINNHMKTRVVKRCLQIVFLLVLLFAANVLLSTNVFAGSDNKGPVIDSFTADKTEVTVGDIVTFTIKANDESGIIDSPSKNYISLQYGDGQWKHIRFDKVDETTLTGTLEITDTFVDGDYSLLELYVEDIYGNRTSAGNDYSLTIHVSGAISDNKGPVIDSFTADKTEVTVGDIVTFTIKANYESGIIDSPSKNYISLQYGDGKWKYIRFDKVDETTLTGTLEITDTFVDGDYSLLELYVEDIYGNRTSAGNDYSLTIHVIPKDLYENTSDIQDLDGVSVINSNTSMYGNIIQGDLYIAPNAIATLNNVTINGDIFVLGTLRANSISANTIHMKSMIVGGTAYGNGAASISGSCSISSTIASNKVIEEVPLRIDTDLISVDGSLSIKGTYANIATMYVNDNQVNATSSGKFYLNDIDVGDATTINIKFVTAEGETFTKDYDIVVGTLDSDGKPNGIPVIKANDISICEGAELDLLDGVNASDHEDGDISNNVVASPNSLSTSEPGEYDVQYSVTDSQGTETTKTIKVEIRSHEWNTGTVVTDASCTKDGQKKYVYANCNKEKTEVIPATGHSFSDEFTTDAEATCTTEGSKSKHCTKCEEVTEVTAIPANGHTFGSWEVITPSTCEGAGSHQHSCEVCGFTEAEATDPTGHEIEDNYTIDVPATCTTDGSQSKHCKNCEVTFDSEVIPATGHSYGDWKTTLEPTCTEKGSKEQVCSACGDRVTEEMPSLGHAWNAKPTVDKEATCTEAGAQSIHCARCNETKDAETIAALGHDWSTTPTVDKKATCTEDGKESTHCTRCDAVQEGSEKAIQATGHKLSSWTTTKKATEIAAGQQTRACTECGKTETKSIAQLKPTLPAVKIAAPKAAKKAATVKWKKVSKANQKKIAKIQIQYSTDKNFKKGVKTIYAKKSATSKKITKLTSKKTYYIRIRAYKKSGSVVHVSKWSTVKKVKAK